MITTGRLLPFLGTVFALFLAPGPSVVFVVSRGVAFGRLAALTAVAGNTLGLATQLIVVVLGPGLLNSRELFHVLKIAGALYLLYLGIRTIAQRRAFAEGPTLQLASLGAIGVLLALVCDGAWGLASGTVRSWLGESARPAERLNGAGGVLMVSFGIVLVVIAIR